MKRTKKPNGKNGYKYKPEYNDIAFVACKKSGYKQRELAELLGVSRATIDLWIREREGFKEAVRTGTDLHDTEHVEDKLKLRAMGYQYKEVKEEQIVLKQGRGKNKVAIPAVKTTTTTKQVVPDVGAICFYLKNRNPKRWKEIKAIEFTGTMDGSFEHKMTQKQQLLDALRGMPKHELEQLSILVKDLTDRTKNSGTGPIGEVSKSVH